MRKLLEMARRIAAGDRAALSRAITLIESSRELDRSRASDLMRACSSYKAQAIAESATGSRPPKRKSLRIGFAGPPGAGKSTLIESLGMHLIDAHGAKVAVMAIDPSSARSGGSILGDKTRMQGLAHNAAAFVRASPTRGMLGGLARYTYDALQLFDSAGYDVVIVETVGVGQSELSVEQVVDVVVLVLPPGGGDELQGSKKVARARHDGVTQCIYRFATRRHARDAVTDDAAISPPPQGIIEIADVIVVNKADGVLAKVAQATAAQYSGVLALSRRKHDNWATPIFCVSAVEREGLSKVGQRVVPCRIARDAVQTQLSMRVLCHPLRRPLFSIDSISSGEL